MLHRCPLESRALQAPPFQNKTSSETLGVNLSGVEHTLNRLKVQLDSGFSKFQTWEVSRGRMFISTSWPHVQTQGGSGCHLPSLGPKLEKLRHFVVRRESLQNWLNMFERYGVVRHRIASPHGNTHN